MNAMRPIFRGIHAVGAAVLLSSALALAQTPSTTWTGAVSTDWNNAGNWTNGVPNGTKNAVIGPATRGCSIAAAATPPICMDLTVNAGASLTMAASSRLQLTGNLDYAATVLGTGTIEMVSGGSVPMRTVRGRNGASLHTLNANGIAPAPKLEVTDLTARASLVADILGMDMYGRNEIMTLLSFRLPPGLARLWCEPTGTLIVGHLDTLHSVVVPATFRATRMSVPYSSSITSSAGVIVFPTGSDTTMDTFGGSVGPTLVAPGATLRVEGTGGFFGDMACDGTVVVGSGCVSLRLNSLNVSGTLRFAGPNNNFSSTFQLQGTTVVQAGGSLVLDPFFRPALSIAGNPQIHGTFDFRGGTRVYAGGTVNVGSTGRLHMSALSFVRPELIASEVRVQGQLYAADCLMALSGPGGLQLLPGSDIQQTFLATLTSTSTNLNAVLLDVSRTQPTVLREMIFGSSTGSNPAKGVRASSPYPVQVLSSIGPRAGAAFEDDPYGVISWSNGVTYGGAATPGCLGLAECETTSDARMGNAAFAFRVRRAHPNMGAIFLLGLGSTTVPAPFAGLQLWFDPALPLSSVFRTSDATGTVLSPQPLPINAALVGLTCTGQFVLFEPTGCTPTNLSASTAVRVVLQP